MFSGPPPDRLEIRKTGGSLGVIFPDNLRTRLNLKEGGQVYFVELPDRSLILSPRDPKHAEVTRVARKVMDECKDTFRELAK